MRAVGIIKVKSTIAGAGVKPGSFCEYEVSLLIADYYYYGLFVLESLL